MSKVTAPFFSHSASGSIKKTLQAGSLRGTHWMRAPHHRAYTRTILQSPQRILFQEAKTAWIALSSASKINYSLLANALHPPITGYNYFLRLYLTGQIQPAPPPTDFQSLLYFNGDQDSTTFTDESGKIWTAHGEAHLDISQYVSPPSSGRFNGIDAFIETPDHEDFNFIKEDFTVECRIRISAAPTWFAGMLFEQTIPSPNRFMGLYIYGLAGLEFDVMSEEDNIYSVWGDFEFELNAWYRVAIVKHEGVLQLYINCTPTGDSADMSTDTMPNCSSPLRIGTGIDSPLYFNGWIDDFKLSKGNIIPQIP